MYRVIRLSRACQVKCQGSGWTRPLHARAGRRAATVYWYAGSLGHATPRQRLGQAAELAMAGRSCRSANGCSVRWTFPISPLARFRQIFRSIKFSFCVSQSGEGVEDLEVEVCP